MHNCYRLAHVAGSVAHFDNMHSLAECFLFICFRCPCCRSQLVQAKEESVEMGGYFICNGIERIIRMLIQQRRHYIMALRRGAYHKRGKDYTDCATLIRSGSSAACVCTCMPQTYKFTLEFASKTPTAPVSLRSNGTLAVAQPVACRCTDN